MLWIERDHRSFRLSICWTPSVNRTPARTTGTRWAAMIFLQRCCRMSVVRDSWDSVEPELKETLAHPVDHFIGNSRRTWASPSLSSASATTSSSARRSTTSWSGACAWDAVPSTPTTCLQLDPPGGGPKLDGIETTDPTFGLPAFWIKQDARGHAQVSGYTVVDPPSIIVTHLTELIRRHACDLLGRQQVQEMLDAVAQTMPKLVSEVVPDLLPLGVVQKVLQNLLKESVPVRDLPTILEALGDYAAKTKDPELLTELVRERLAAQISAQLAPDGKVGLLVRYFPDNVQACGNHTPGSLVEGTECSPQASDDLMFSVSCGRKASCPYFPSSRRISPVIFTLPSIASVYAGAGLGRRSSISRRIFRNKSLGTATSANWNVT